MSGFQLVFYATEVTTDLLKDTEGFDQFLDSIMHYGEVSEHINGALVIKPEPAHKEKAAKLIREHFPGRSQPKMVSPYDLKVARPA